MREHHPLPPFATSDWYSNPADHRCPHDAWLESVEISEPAEGARNEQRRTAITVRLLGAYHDGHIVFRYTGVRKYAFESKSCGRGLGDWLRDDITTSTDGTFVHNITWAGFLSKEMSHWRIEAEDVSCEWIPKNG